MTPISTATNKAGKAITVARRSPPVYMAITPDGKAAYVANEGCDCPGLNRVYVINTATNKPSFISGFTAPDYIAITPNGKTAYVANGAQTP